MKNRTCKLNMTEMTLTLCHRTTARGTPGISVVGTKSRIIEPTYLGLAIFHGLWMLNPRHRHSPLDIRVVDYNFLWRQNPKLDALNFFYWCL